MTITRRSFSFASLAALIGGPAVARAAAPPIAQQARAQAPNAIPELEDAPAPPVVHVAPRLARKGQHVEVTLVVRNIGRDAVPVMTLRGSRPGAYVQLLANVAGNDVESSVVVAAPDRRELMSRMGPMPRWTNVAAGHTVEIGPYLFTAADASEFHVTGTVQVGDQIAPFDVVGVRIASKAS